MSAPATPSSAPVTGKRQLVDSLERGCKPRDQWRIGTEHEKFGYTDGDLRPLPYDGKRGIKAMLDGLAALGWEKFEETGKVIALLDGQGASVSLEPGGQLELSGGLMENIHQTAAEVTHHLEQVKQVAEPLGIGFLGAGFQPKWGQGDIPWMPKGRYDIMRRYMPLVGGKGLDMMLRTCTVQVNLDFASEADMVKKLRVSLALQSIATALFASSPFVDGKPSGLLSARADVWTDTDPHRTGPLPFAFEDGMGFERYVDWMLDVPMYFVYRDGKYIDAAGQSFRDFMAGKLPALPGETPTMGDWADHLTTAFPDVRLKQFLEMRGADAGPWRRLCALPALWTGLLYDDVALDGAWQLVKDWTAEDRHGLRRDVPAQALAAKVGGRTVRDIAADVLALASGGLKRRARLNDSGRDESIYLDTLENTVRTGRTPAEDMLEAYEGRWQGCVDPIFKEYAY
ncbi:glutamate--cysteine ligase [Paramagnetospirillum kuznetsovii]|uniref:Glutamate--cysteine ligase n=1 Tax=Paramagnetospirillum kuznetsovii TaxID=2053833 RepID=A0A364NXU8_9PROT|nr:glutamate--cysteine ligase [Paramagnetospirillum kuznetsovii]RAU21904.1 glutamate--cysteine ligase [Paramagnetospirillum kuznetsovii]